MSGTYAGASDAASATIAETPVPAAYAYQGSPLISEAIVWLALFSDLFFNLASAKALQTGAETLLLALLLYAVTTIRLGRWEASLLALFVVMTAISFSINDVSVAVTNAKHFGLAVLALIYFSRVRHRSPLIFPAVVLSVGLIVIGRVIPSVVAPLTALAKDPEFNESRFGGLFLNAHYNAYFLAVALIYYGYRRRLYGLGAVILYLTASKFVFVSYLASVAARLKLVAFVSRYRTIVVGVVVALLILLIRYQGAITDYLNTPELASASVIISQALDSRFYQLVLNPFPADYLTVVANLKLSYDAVSISNEIGFFAMCIQGGTPLAILYLVVLMRRAKFFRIFIVVSLLHYGFVLSPLIVYMIVTYSREICMVMDGRPSADSRAFSAPQEGTHLATVSGPRAHVEAD